MDKKLKYLVFGANGLIGRALYKRIQKNNICIGTYFKRPETNLQYADITSSSDIERLIDQEKPDYVINCSNLSGGVDFCEYHPDIAKKYHLEANSIIGCLAQKHQSRFVFISTDYIFDGKSSPNKEEDIPHPLNVYGQLKLDAERWVLQNVSKYTVVRTTNVFGWDPASITPNYIMNLYNTIHSDKQFKAPSFLWGNPTYVDDLAAGIIELCANEIDGIFHIVGSSFTNRYEWAKKACQIIGLDESQLIETKEIPENMTPRPFKSNLNTQKFRKHCQTRLRNTTDGLKAFVEEMSNNL
jgi:dTDP-4-dehydrorhamnose reductase